MDSGVYRHSGVKRPRPGTPAASSSTAMPPPKPKVRQHDRTPPETGTVVAEKHLGSREIGEVSSARRSALPAIWSTLLKGPSSSRYGDGSGMALPQDDGGSEGAGGRACGRTGGQWRYRSHVESSAAATASNNNDSSYEGKADGASGAGGAVASRSVAALTVSRILQLEHGATESKACKRQQAGNSNSVRTSSIVGYSGMSEGAWGCGQAAATTAENGEGATDAEVGGGDEEAAVKVAIGVLSFESLREGDVAVSSLFLEDDTGRVRLTCAPPPPPSWLGKVVCLSRWTLARDERLVGAPRQKNVPGGIETRPSTSRAPSSLAPSSSTTRMACFTAYLEVTEMTLLVRRQRDKGSGISGADKKDSNSNRDLAFGVGDGRDGIGNATGRMLSNAGGQARDREERCQQQVGGGRAAAGGGRGGVGDGDGGGEEGRCGWSCVRRTDVRRPTLSTVTSEGALGLDAFVDRKGRGPLNVVARVAAVSPIVRFKNAPPFFMVEVEQAEPQLERRQPQQQQQQQQQQQKEQEGEARQRPTDLQAPRGPRHRQHQQRQQLHQQHVQANERQHQSQGTVHDSDSESSSSSALLSPSQAKTSPPSEPPSPPFSSPLPTTQEICRSPEEISALFPFSGSRDDDRAGRPPPISGTAACRQQRSSRAVAPAPVVRRLGGHGSGSHAGPEKRKGTSARDDARGVDSVGGGVDARGGGFGGDDARAGDPAGEKGDPGIGVDGKANSSHSQRQQQHPHRSRQLEVQETSEQQANQQLTAMFVLNGRRCLPWQAFLVPGKTFVFPRVGAFVLGGKSRSSSNSGGKQSTTYRAFGDAGGKGGGAGASGPERHLVEVDARGLDTRGDGGSIRTAGDGDHHQHSTVPPKTTSKPSSSLADGSPLATEGTAQAAVRAAGVGRTEGRTAGDRGRLCVGPACDAGSHGSVDGGEGVDGQEDPTCQRGRRCHSGCGCCVITYEGRVTALAGQAGTYVLDGGKGRVGINLFLQHLSCSSLGAGLRRGATIRVHNVHPVYAGARLIGLGACLRSMVQVVRFSPLGETATYRALTGGGTSLPLAVHAWRYAFNTAFLRKELPTPSRPPQHHHQHEEQGKGHKAQQQQQQLGLGKESPALTASSSSFAATDESPSPPPSAFSGFVTARDLTRLRTSPAVNEGKSNGLTPVTPVMATVTEMKERVCEWVFGRKFGAMALPKRDVYAEFLDHPSGVCTVVDGANGVYRADPGSSNTSRGSVSCRRGKPRKSCCQDEERSGGGGVNGGQGSRVRTGASAEDGAEGEGADLLEHNEEVLIQRADEGWHGDSPEVPRSSSSSSSCDGDACHAGGSASCVSLSASRSVSPSAWCRSPRRGPSPEEMLRAASRPISESLEVATQYAVESISIILSQSVSRASGGDGGESYRGAKRRRGSTHTAPAAAAAATRAMKNATFTVRTPFGSVAGREDGLLGWLHHEGSGVASSRRENATATATGLATAAAIVGRARAVAACADDLPAAAVAEKGGARPQVKPITATGSSTDRGCRPSLRPGDASVPIANKKAKLSADDEAAQGCGGGSNGEGAAGGATWSWLADRTARVKVVLLATRSPDAGWSSAAAVKVAAGPLLGVAAGGSNDGDDSFCGGGREYRNARGRRPGVAVGEGEGEGGDGGARACCTLALVRKFAVCTEVVVLGPAGISSTSASSQMRRAAPPAAVPPATASSSSLPALASSSASTSSAATVASASAGTPKAVTESTDEAAHRPDRPPQEDGRAHGDDGPSHSGPVFQLPPPGTTTSSSTYTASETMRVVGGFRVLLRSYLVVDEADMSVMPGCTGSQSDVSKIVSASGYKLKPGKHGVENGKDGTKIERRTFHVGDADRCGRPMAHQGLSTNAAAVRDRGIPPTASSGSAAVEEDQPGQRSSPSSLPPEPCPPIDERRTPPPRTSPEQQSHDRQRQQGQQQQQKQHLSVSEALVVRLACNGQSSSTPSAGAGNTAAVGRAGDKRSSRGGGRGWGARGARGPKLASAHERESITVRGFLREVGFRVLADGGGDGGRREMAASAVAVAKSRGKGKAGPSTSRHSHVCSATAAAASSASVTVGSPRNGLNAGVNMFEVLAEERVQLCLTLEEGLDKMSVYLGVESKAWPVGMVPGYCTVQVNGVCRRLSGNGKSVYLTVARAGGGIVQVLSLALPPPPERLPALGWSQHPVLSSSKRETSKGTGGGSHPGPAPVPGCMWFNSGSRQGAAAATTATSVFAGDGADSANFANPEAVAADATDGNYLSASGPVLVFPRPKPKPATVALHPAGDIGGHADNVAARRDSGSSAFRFRGGGDGGSDVRAVPSTAATMVKGTTSGRGVIRATRGGRALLLDTHPVDAPPSPPRLAVRPSPPLPLPQASQRQAQQPPPSHQDEDLRHEQTSRTSGSGDRHCGITDRNRFTASTAISCSSETSPGPPPFIAGPCLRPSARPSSGHTLPPAAAGAERCASRPFSNAVPTSSPGLVSRTNSKSLAAAAEKEVSARSATTLGGMCKRGVLVRSTRTFSCLSVVAVRFVKAATWCKNCGLLREKDLSFRRCWARCDVSSSWEVRWEGSANVDDGTAQALLLLDGEDVVKLLKLSTSARDCIEMAARLHGPVSFSGHSGGNHNNSDGGRTGALASAAALPHPPALVKARKVLAAAAAGAMRCSSSSSVTSRGCYISAGCVQTIPHGGGKGMGGAASFRGGFQGEGGGPGAGMNGRGGGGPGYGSAVVDVMGEGMETLTLPKLVVQGSGLKEVGAREEAYGVLGRLGGL